MMLQNSNHLLSLINVTKFFTRNEQALDCLPLDPGFKCQIQSKAILKEFLLCFFIIFLFFLMTWTSHCYNYWRKGKKWKALETRKLESLNSNLALKQKANQIISSVNNIEPKRKSGGTFLSKVCNRHSMKRKAGVYAGAKQYHCKK